MKSATLLAILATTMTTLVSAGGMHSIPAGSRNGVYAHTIDSDGNPKATFLGPHPPSTGSSGPEVNNKKRSSSSSSIISVPSAKFLLNKRDAAHCDNNNPNPKYIDRSDSDEVLSQVYVSSINGTHFSGTKSWVVNSVTAFACDYGHGQNFNGEQWNQWVDLVTVACGADVGGYEDLPGSKSSYGRTTTGYGFC